MGGVGVLDPPAKQPSTVRERFCEKVHKVCVRSAKIVHVLQKEFKRGAFSSNSAQTPTNRPKTLPSVSLESHGKTVVSLHPEH